MAVRGDVVRVRSRRGQRKCKSREAQKPRRVMLPRRANVIMRAITEVVGQAQR